MSVFNVIGNLNAVPVVQDDDTVLDLVGILVSAPGSLVIKNGKDATVTIVIPAAVTDETVTALPVTIWTNITRVMEATTIADADLTGLTLA